MIAVVRKDILLVLKESRHILIEKNSQMLKELSNHTIHNASIFQDEDSLSIAVIIYSLSKLIERNRLDVMKAEKEIAAAERALTEERISDYEHHIKHLFSLISKSDTKLRMYIEEVVQQAQVKKGSKLVAHGLSTAHAAELLGISEWELMSYVGNTTISDDYHETIDVRKRIGTARSLFGLGGVAK